MADAKKAAIISISRRSMYRRRGQTAHVLHVALAMHTHLGGILELSTVFVKHPDCL